MPEDDEEFDYEKDYGDEEEPEEDENDEHRTFRTTANLRIRR